MKRRGSWGVYKKGKIRLKRITSFLYEFQLTAALVAIVYAVIASRGEG